MNRVVILAGGKGERLRPYTEDCPKPMVRVMGKPILAYQVRWLAAHDLRRITICCGHLSQSIVDYFGDGSKFNAEINYLVEDKQLGRGGALRNALESMPDNDLPVIAMNGDIITNLSLNELLQHHTDSDALATLVSVPLISPYGIVQFDERGMVSGFQEKPELPFWINAGIYVLDPKLVKRLPKNGDHETTTFPEIAAEGKLSAFRSNAFWRAIDTVKDLTSYRRSVNNSSLTICFSAEVSSFRG